MVKCQISNARGNQQCALKVMWGLGGAVSPNVLDKSWGTSLLYQQSCLYSKSGWWQLWLVWFLCDALARLDWGWFGIWFWAGRQYYGISWRLLSWFSSIEQVWLTLYIRLHIRLHENLSGLFTTSVWNWNRILLQLNLSHQHNRKILGCILMVNPISDVRFLILFINLTCSAAQGSTLPAQILTPEDTGGRKQVK